MKNTVAGGALALLWAVAGCASRETPHEGSVASESQALDTCDCRVAQPNTCDACEATFSLTHPSSRSLRTHGVSASQRVTLADRVRILGEFEDYGTVVNAGNSEINFGVDSRVGSTWSTGNVVLRNRATIQGDLFHAGAYQPYDGAVVTGQITAGSISFGQHSVELEFPTPNGDDHYVEPQDEDLTLAPGGYGNVVIKSGRKLHLSSGKYGFKLLELHPSTTLDLDVSNGPVYLMVRDSLTYRGAVTTPGGSANGVFWGYVGTATAHIEAPFVGTLVAPDAEVKLGTVTGTHVGAFFAKALEVQADATVRVQHFTGPEIPDPAAEGEQPSARGFGLQVRWLDDQGQTITDFSNLPNQVSPPGGFHPLALTVADGHLDVEVTNVEPAGGRTLGYSVSLQGYGLGGITLAAPIPPGRIAATNGSLDPGEIKTLSIDLRELPVQGVGQVNRGYARIGIHAIDGGTPAEEPFVYLASPSFYYHFEDGELQFGSGHYVEPPIVYDVHDGDSPAGVPGVLSRVASGELGAGLFRPNGQIFLINLDSPFPVNKFHSISGPQNAHQNDPFVLGSTLIGNRPASFGPCSPAPAADQYCSPFAGIALPMFTTAPPAVTPGSKITKVCAVWPANYVDSGAGEDYVAGAPGSDQHVPASFVSAVLLDRNNQVVQSGNLDVTGCFQNVTLSSGEYMLLVDSGNISAGTGTGIVSAQVTTPTQPSGVALLQAIRVNNAAALTPEGVVATFDGWDEVTNVAALASHALARHTTEGLGLQDQLYRFRTQSGCEAVAGQPKVSCTDGTFVQIGPRLATNYWVPDAQWKYVIGHEMGHAVFHSAAGGFNVSYSFAMGALDPDCATAACRCDDVETANASHCLGSLERLGAAQHEGFGHYFATRLWADSCTFNYYKQVPGDIFPPTPIDCSTPALHRLNQCAAAGMGTERDWLGFYWEATSTFGVQRLMDIYKNACTVAGIADPSTGKCNVLDSNRPTLAELVAGATPAEQTTLSMIGDEHGVSDNGMYSLACTL